MNLHAIASQTFPDNFLASGNWEQAAYYELSSNSLFWNRAAIIVLSDIVTNNADEALLYLLQKQAKILGIWRQHWQNEIPTIKEFLSFFSAEKGFNIIEGKLTSPTKFWESYNPTISGLLEEPAVEFTKDGEIISYVDVIQKKDITKVLCFDDEWNEQNYFIKTNREWILFHWNTGG